ncbi:MAG: hypothetical protein A3B86_01650 [Candidatus Yanofskybacteria bacterium RIFCSPHIGHO2_02_FULL_38_22b]|uniref:Adenylate kinase n=1 Tax=Candidatus Yanofskybacteria bacterium RIFCSPHIGHO2_02_FULL_38_22b TaxID=1802673 RepID=A0A1F8F4D0_9BACT|nr:MAG: hypothetical protein A3B86_01650 [Candidatus Yanofskybacteria bacterium RIFCSPHIGHO2_02_FULL_38_22b]OGN19946.1 MAG: hypothetical protein A2910_00360 [Candidatus Yanofskybacteria bacterium RIFCSPLOWO2_01_FULL_39_28]
MKWAVVLIGPPGSGKGTQADLLAEKFGLIHIESSKIIEEKFKNASPDDLLLSQQKKIWQSGELNDPKMVTGWLVEAMKNVWQSGAGLILSASPRTVFEAEAEIPVLEELYGKDNVKIFNIDLSREESFNRNSNRRICEKNRHPVPNLPEFKDLETCPRDGSKLIRRGHLDDPETVKLRYDVYLKRTEPIIDLLKNRGYEIIQVNGEQSIEDVYKEVIQKLDDSNKNTTRDTDNA